MENSRPRSYEVWEDLSGQKTNVKDMSLEHICKVIKYIIKQEENTPDEQLTKNKIWSFVLIAEICQRGYTFEELKKIFEEMENL